MSEYIETRLEDGVLRVRFNRPEKKNAVNTPMWDAIREAFQAAGYATFATSSARTNTRKSGRTGTTIELARSVKKLTKPKEMTLFVDLALCASICCP